MAAGSKAGRGGEGRNGAHRNGKGPGRRPPACVECGDTTTTWRRRGLCWVCYDNPAIRLRTPELVPGSPLDPDETDLIAGRDYDGEAAPWPGPLPEDDRAARVAALAARAKLRQELFAPRRPVLDPAALDGLERQARRCRRKRR